MDCPRARIAPAWRAPGIARATIDACCHGILRAAFPPRLFPLPYGDKKDEIFFVSAIDIAICYCARVSNIPFFVFFGEGFAYIIRYIDRRLSPFQSSPMNSPMQPNISGDRMLSPMKFGQRRVPPGRCNKSAPSRVRINLHPQQHGTSGLCNQENH